jgi:hypothetical protein
MRRTQNRKCFSSHIIIFLSTAFILFVWGCGEDEPNPPIIFSVTAEPDIVPPGEASTLTVEAGDMDKDELSYSWVVPDGRIEGSGKTVNWIAPEVEGKYQLTVTVSDGTYSVPQSVDVWAWTPRPGDYYPLEIGNTWTYRDNDDNAINFEIVDTIVIESSDTTTFVKQMTTSDLQEAANFSYIAEDSDVVYQYGMGGSNAGGDTILFAPELPLYKFPLIPGETWEVEFQVNLPEGYYIGEGTAIYEVMSEEELTTEAGSFQHVFQVKEDFTWKLLGEQIDRIITYHWLAPNVGVVKFVQEENIGEETIVTEAILQSYSVQ